MIQDEFNELRQAWRCGDWFDRFVIGLIIFAFFALVGLTFL